MFEHTFSSPHPTSLPCFLFLEEVSYQAEACPLEQHQSAHDFYITMSHIGPLLALPALKKLHLRDMEKDALVLRNQNVYPSSLTSPVVEGSDMDEKVLEQILVRSPRLETLKWSIGVDVSKHKCYLYGDEISRILQQTRQTLQTLQISVHFYALPSMEPGTGLRWGWRNVLGPCLKEIQGWRSLRRHLRPVRVA